MVLVWAARRPGRLSRRAQRMIRDSRHVLELSALSVSEIAIKNRSGKLDLPEADLQQVLEELNIRVLPYTGAHAMKLFGLAWHHTDPFDRQILAQALAEDIPIITSDKVFALYEGVRVIW
jgi:PIN domain nuclease of toxin-antitoxin system